MPEFAIFVAACVARYGRIDVAFNNAGIETPRAAPLHEQSIEDWDNVLRTNTRGVFLSMKHELPHMTGGRPRSDHQQLLGRGGGGVSHDLPVHRQRAWHRLTDQGRRARVRRQEHSGQRGGSPLPDAGAIHGTNIDASAGYLASNCGPGTRSVKKPW